MTFNGEKKIVKMIMSLKEYEKLKTANYRDVANCYTQPNCL